MSKNNNYIVSWVIDCESTTPEAAAAEAFLAMQRTGTTATVFSVVNTKTQEKTEVDVATLETGTIPKNYRFLTRDP